MKHLLFALALTCVLPGQAPAQLTPEKAMETFTVADGLELSLFASEPDFVNPTSIDVDHKGRVWVCEAVNYRRKNFGRPILRAAGDRIVILEDSKGTGKADKVHVFYQDPSIVAPLGVAVAPYPDGKGQRVYVCQSPDILVFEDKDGDLKADGPPTKLLTGFRGIDHDHGVHGINIGPDGKLYFTVGDSGVQNLQASDGKGKKWTSNSTDVRAGTVWRCDRDGKELELIAHNFRNNYECCVDSFGSIFLSDNDDDGNQQTRICYVMPGGNYGYHPRGPGQTHWHEEQPGVVHKVMRTGFGSPCGICFYEGSLLPKKYHGQLLHADAGPREIRCFHLKPNGAGYDCEKEVLVTSKDNWFRPSDVCVAPDGSVFIADWYDPGVGGHGMGDWTRGRIYRLTPKGLKDYRVPETNLDVQGAVVEALGSPNIAVRSLAMGAIARMSRNDAVKLLTRSAREDGRKDVRARALWQLRQYDSFRGLMLSALFDNDSSLRVLAWRIWGQKFSQESGTPLFADPKEIKKFLEQEPTFRVRRELLLFSRETDPSMSKDLILEFAKQYDGKDRFYLNAIGIAVGTDPERRKVILADFEKHFPEWNDKVADLVWELRPPGMMPKLGKMLGDAKLSASSRARIIDILAASDDLSAGRTMLEVLQSDVPAEVHDKVIANLKLFLPTKWKELRQGKDLERAATNLLKEPRTRVTALALLGVSERPDCISCVHGYAINDSETLPVRREAIRSLGLIPSPKAVELLEAALDLQRASSPVAADLVLALGTHVNRKGDGPESKSALRRLQMVIENKGAASEWKTAALSALADSRPGTLWLLDLHAKAELPEAIKPETARLLRNSRFQDLRNKAMVAFPPPGRIDPKKLPPITALVKRKGNVERGKQLYLASAKNDMLCAKCHTVHGVGGQIGPDLSMIGKKASRENLLESILAPSKAVADQYINWQIETGKGQALNGLIVEETPEHVLLRDANGKDTRVPKKDIDSRRKGDKSLMPEDIVVYLTEADLIDLTEYMLTLKTASLTVPAWHIAGPFDNGQADEGLDKVHPPEKGVDLKASYAGKSGKVGWRIVRPDGAGYVDLRGHHGGTAEQIVSYLYQEIESPADQEATILIGNDDAVKLWLNGAKLHEDRRHNAATPAANQVKVKLKKGLNTVLLKINNGDGPHGFYLTILAEQELKCREVK